MMIKIKKKEIIGEDIVVKSIQMINIKEEREIKAIKKEED